jgi:hypothetical protein
VWVDPFTLDFDGLRIGVRSNRAETRDALRVAFGRYVVGDPEAKPNFSVRVTADPKRAHLLHWGGCVVTRSFDADRVVRSLLQHIEVHLDPPDGTIAVRSLPYVGPHGAILLPAPLDDDLRMRDRRLRDAGYVALDSPRSFVDPVTAELVVTDRLELDRAALAEATDGLPRRRHEPTIEVGRYPIERWMFVDYTGLHGPLSRAGAGRAVAMQLLTDNKNVTAEKLELFAGIFTRARGFAMELGYRGSIVRSVTSQGRE